MSNQHNKCYARDLGDCAGPISGEHPFSKGVMNVFEPLEVFVAGASWQKAGERSALPVSALKANVLCKHHNSLLSPLDHAAQKMFTFAFAKNVSSALCVLKGNDIERWLLKVHWGTICAGTTKGLEAHMRTTPPRRELDTIFCGAPLEEGIGMAYPCAHLRFTPMLASHWQPIMDDQSAEVRASCVSMWFLRLMILRRPLSMAIQNNMLGLKDLRLRPSSIRIDFEGDVREIQFEGFTGKPVIVHTRMQPFALADVS